MNLNSFIKKIVLKISKLIQAVPIIIFSSELFEIIIFFNFSCFFLNWKTFKGNYLTMFNHHYQFFCWIDFLYRNQARGWGIKAGDWYYSIQSARASGESVAFQKEKRQVDAAFSLSLSQHKHKKNFEWKLLINIPDISVGTYRDVILLMKWTDNETNKMRRYLS